MENKMTQAKAVEYVLNNETIKAFLPEDVKERLASIVTALAKKKNTPKKPTKTQTENATLLNAIIGRMEEGKKYTITVIINVFPECAGLFPSKISAVIKSVWDKPDSEGNVPVGAVIHREEIKGKAYFSLIADNGENEGEGE